MTSEDVKKLLSAKHAEDVFLTECKDGPSGTGVVRLDAWAMAKSWAHPTTWGYEIKVSRADFLRDTKWRSYLALCSDFYFVCPFGLIQPEELPPDAGLLWASKEGTRLWTKKKAPSRDVQIPETLWRYIIMCRSRIRDEMEHDKGAYWRQWLAKTEQEQADGHHISARVAKLGGQRIHEIETENRVLKARAERVDAMEKAFNDAGVSLRTWSPEREAKAFADRISQAVKPEDMQAVKQAHEALGRAVALLEPMQPK